MGLQASFTLQDSSACQSTRVLTDSKSLIQCLSQDPTRQTKPTFCSIWAAVSANGASNKVNVQWIPAHMGLEGNAAANQEAKRGSMLLHSSDITSATEALKRHQRSIAEDRYLSDPRTSVYRVFTGRQHCYQHWQRDRSRDQCVTMAQVRTGHSPLVAAYLHCIGRWDSAICPHCQGTEETVEHLVFQCPAHDQARRDTWPGDSFTNRSTIPLELPGTDWGGDPPPRPGMRGREKYSAEVSYTEPNMLWAVIEWSYKTCRMPVLAMPKRSICSFFLGSNFFILSSLFLLSMLSLP